MRAPVHPFHPPNRPAAPVAASPAISSVFAALTRRLILLTCADDHPGTNRGGGLPGEQQGTAAAGHLRHATLPPPIHAYEGTPRRHSPEIPVGLNQRSANQRTANPRSPRSTPTATPRRISSTTCSSSTRASTRASSSLRSLRCATHASPSPPWPPTGSRGPFAYPPGHPAYPPVYWLPRR